MKTLLTIVALGAAYVVGWPMAKDAAVDRVQAHPAKFLKMAGLDPRIADSLATLSQIGSNVPMIKAMGHQSALNILEEMPLDRQIQIVFTSSTM